MPDLSASDIRPFIPAQSFEESKRFYSSIGWTVKDVAPRLALVELQDGRFYLQDYYLKEFAENAMLHIRVEDARAWYEHVLTVLKDNRFPAARVQPPKAQPYGAIVTFVHDPAGVLLHLCQWTS
ncbi:MAG: hypothetical protein ACREV7_18135 [Steroidobacteraceae bacterium]